MDFDSMDWKSDAARLSAAFGIDGCEWWGTDKPTPLLRLTGTSMCPEIDGLTLTVECDCNGRYFEITGYGDDDDWSKVDFDWQGNVISKRWDFGLKPSLILAKALFHLDLLTPETEAVLGVTISAHQKIEWALEFDSRNAVASE